MNKTQIAKAVKLTAKIVSSLLAGFIIYMLAGDLVNAIRHPDTVRIHPLATAAGRHDALMLGLMVLVVAAMLLVWWKEKAGAWLSMISITTIIGCVWYLNGIPMRLLAGFFLAAAPAVIILITRRFRHAQ